MLPAMKEAQTLSDGEHRVGEDDIRLDRALRACFADSSWGQLRRAIRSGKVAVDGAIIREPSKRLRQGAMLRVTMATPRHTRRADKRLPRDTIVYADPHVVVAHKPAGMASVPDEQRTQGTLVQLLNKQLSRSGRRTQLGVVQRLDVDTSGLLVFSRSREALTVLKEQLKERTVRRSYLALVAGRARTQSYSGYLTEHRDGKRKSTRYAHLGKYARTHVELLEPLQEASLIRCRLDTGRTHQIRIHLSEAGHPLLGDPRYARRHIRMPPAPRLMLHATALGFDHPNGEAMDFEIPPPPDFQQLLEKLRSRE